MSLKNSRDTFPMTSTSLSKSLARIGVTYSPSAVRKAWAAGAPRGSAEKFAAWLVIQSRSATAAVKAAESASGIKRDATGALCVDSAQQALALMVDIWRPHGVALYLASNALLWQTITQPLEDGPTIEQLGGGKFVGAMMQAMPHLRDAFEALMPVLQQLRAAGVTADSQAWVKAAQTGDGIALLNETAKQHFAKFAEIPEE